MHELEALLSRLKMEHLSYHVESLLEQFDFTFQPGIDRKIVRELASLAFVERCENVRSCRGLQVSGKPIWPLLSA